MFGILVWDTKPVRQAEKEKPIDFSTGFLISFWWEGGLVLRVASANASALRARHAKHGILREQCSPSSYGVTLRCAKH